MLDYIVTSNHIHLLVCDSRNPCISKSAQLIAGCVAQEYNNRKSRRGAFWGDRDFAAAVAADRHFARRLVYIDLNLNVVRAAVVMYPPKWKVCGFNEILSPRLRYWIIDIKALCELTVLVSAEAFRLKHQGWVEQELARGESVRLAEWTEAAAGGPDDFKAAFLARKSRSK